MNILTFTVEELGLVKKVTGFLNCTTARGQVTIRTRLEGTVGRKKTAPATDVF